MRIVHFLNHTGAANGHVNVAVDLACEQSRQGHDVWIMAGVSDFSHVLEKAGVRYVDLPLPTGPTWSARVLKLLPGLAWFVRSNLGKLRPDVVHSHMPLAALLAWTTRLGASYKLVTTVHNSFDRQAILMGCADKTVCVSKAVLETMESKGVPRRKLEVIWNGVRGSARLPADPPASPPLKRPSLATIAGMHPRKGVPDLLAAFVQVAGHNADVNLYLIGSGPFEAEYRANAAKSAHCDRIHFLGHSADPRSVLRSADIFVLASHSDPFPLAVLEAMDAGCAVVATSVDGIPEALDFGRAGVLVPPHAPNALAAALGEILGDAEKLSELRGAARVRGTHFSVERMASEYIKLYSAAR